MRVLISSGIFVWMKKMKKNVWVSFDEFHGQLNCVLFIWNDPVVRWNGRNGDGGGGGVCVWGGGDMKGMRKKNPCSASPFIEYPGFPRYIDQGFKPLHFYHILDRRIAQVQWKIAWSCTFWANPNLSLGTICIFILANSGSLTSYGILWNIKLIMEVTKLCSLQILLVRSV